MRNLSPVATGAAANPTRTPDPNRMPLTADLCAGQHIGDRVEQQDRVALFPHPTRSGLLLAVLADGMGGHSGGAVAAEQVLHKARQSFESYSPASETPQAFLQAVIEEAHAIIKLTRFTTEADPHSTAVVLLLQPGRVDWAHCGDSRLYHFRDGALVCRTRDHSLVAELVRRGRLTEAEAEAHPHRNVLLNCLGAEREPQVECGVALPAVSGDAFLLCSDGLWAYFDEAELGRTLASNTARAAAEWLIERSRERAFGAGDNVSLAIVKLVERRA
jgi:serine/threonine protein phosphatase PrpC